MRKLILSISLAFTLIAGVLTNPAAAAFGFNCKQTWQVIPNQQSSAHSTIYGGSIGDYFGQDYIAVVAIQRAGGSANYIDYTVAHWDGANEWDGAWQTTLGVTAYPPKVGIIGGGPDIGKLAIVARGVNGNSYYFAFNGPYNVGPWTLASTGSSYYDGFTTNNAFEVDGGWVFLTTGLGAPMYNCYF